MKQNLLLLMLLISYGIHAQSKNFIDQPYLETTAQIDTLVVPDKIYLSIYLSESDTKDRKSIEELENRMQQKLEELGIDTKEQLSLGSLSSNFKDYFLRRTGVLKSTSMGSKLSALAIAISAIPWRPLQP